MHPDQFHWTSAQIPEAPNVNIVIGQYSPYLLIYQSVSANERAHHIYLLLNQLCLFMFKYCVVKSLKSRGNNIQHWSRCDV